MVLVLLVGCRSMGRYWRMTMVRNPGVDVITTMLSVKAPAGS
jgi:hypothetical protein